MPKEAKWSTGKGLENVPGIYWHGGKPYITEMIAFLGEREAIELSGGTSGRGRARDGDYTAAL